MACTEKDGHCRQPDLSAGRMCCFISFLFFIGEFSMRQPGVTFFLAVLLKYKADLSYYMSPFGV
jgi:hypothetical protein